MSQLRPLILSSVVLALGLCVFGLKVSDPPGTRMKTFADSFLSTLDEKQKAAAVVPYESDKRVQWHFIPMDNRKGAVLREMNDAQRSAALRLVRAALSEAGYDKTNKIMSLEGVLRQLEGEGGRNERDPNKYYVTIFGTPDNDNAWGLSFEGHHLSLNFVCRGGKIVDSTPQFFAANPATIKDEVQGPLSKGTRVLRDEEDLAFELVNSLTDNKRTLAMIAEKAPKELRFAGEAQPDVGEPEGISFRSLNSDQRKLLQQLVHVYTDAAAGTVSKERREQIRTDGWSDVHFAWAGATEPGIGHYYRIRGKRFLIELVNTQADAAGNPANHIHSVYRDLTGDFDLPIE
tara:strand:+ start:594803 stop:595840 length:1038 start_codon:yes stop_codon:yes gene_type:complete